MKFTEIVPPVYVLVRGGKGGMNRVYSKELGFCCILF